MPTNLPRFTYISFRLEPFLYPKLLEEHARHFESTEVRKCSPEASQNEAEEKIEEPTPWKVQDPQDPKPLQEWYTPARYFARQLVKEDPTLLNKTDLLVKKIVELLDKVGIKKRGGKKSFNPATIKKALSNVWLR